jgi:hypothetical protein
MRRIISFTRRSGRLVPRRRRLLLLYGVASYVSHTEALLPVPDPPPLMIREG